MSRAAVRALSVVLPLTCVSAVLAVTPQQVDNAIRKGVDYLYSLQNEKGHWESGDAPAAPPPEIAKDPKEVKKWHATQISKTDGGQFGGHTALATYALLDAGESWKKPNVKAAIEWLHRAPLVGTYAVALRAQIWQYLPQNSMVKSAAQRDCNMLLSGMKAKADSRGFWSYLIADHATARYDHSCSQIALLGIWACQQAGRDVPLAFWKEAENAWRGHQNEDGGWGYVFKSETGGASRLSMTNAGVATLFITQDYVHANDGIACKGNLFDDRLIKGTRWIHDHFGEGGGGYVMYGFERVAVASGFKYFGDRDWYKLGSDNVVKKQSANGSWGSIPETTFNLIFLSRGRSPVVVNKFEYELEGVGPRTSPTIRLAPRSGPELLPEANQPDKPVQADTPAKPANKTPTYPANWCQRPRDIAAFTRWMSSALERKFNWQIISSSISVDDYHDAPILYMAGNQKLALPKETVDKLRQYIEEGGLLFGHADCGSAEFTNSFKELGKTLFPTYEFRELPADHPVYTLQQFQRRNWKNPPQLLSMSNGSRELMMISPNNDMARYWQQQQYKDHEEVFQLLSSVVLYASDRQNMRYKGSTHIVRPLTAKTATPEGMAPDDPNQPQPAQTGPTGPLREIGLARLEWPGNWNPEPGGWRRLAAILSNQKIGNLKVSSVKLGEGKLDAAKQPIAHLTGTGSYTLTKEQLTELKKYVVKGGVIVCDAVGGNTDFAEAMQTQLATLITGAKFDLIPPNDPLLSPAKAGAAPAAAQDEPMIATISIPQPVFAPTTQSTTQGAVGAATQPASTMPAMPAPVAARTLLPTDAATQPTTEPAPVASVRVTLPGDFPVSYRKYARVRMGDAQTLRLKGIKFRNKWAVIFSAEDLSTGLVGQQVDGIYGYTPSCATELMRRIVANAAPLPKAPAKPAEGAPPADPSNPNPPAENPAPAAESAPPANQ